MEVYEYENYEEYVEAQTHFNKSKLSWSYFETKKNGKEGPRKGIITIMASKYLGNISGDKNVICHGTRGGHEQKFFKSLYPKGDIVGTEISETATQFPMTVEWDFTKENYKWINKFDIVYSNSFDHTIDPQETLRVWHGQLKEGGFMFIEFSEHSAHTAQRSDPLKATFKEIEKLIIESNFEIAETQKIGPVSGNMYICRKV